MSRIDARLIHASLLAGAIGDSLGADLEFLNLGEIRERFAEGAPGLSTHQGVRGAITDDTQMTLFTAEGIIDARLADASPIEAIHCALLRWLETQGYSGAIKVDFQRGLFLDGRMHAHRAPGTTCVTALADGIRAGEFASNDSKGCGTIMRVAPVGFGFERSLVRQMAVESSALTHGHVTGQLAAAAWAELLADVGAGAALEYVANVLADEYALAYGGAETARAIRSALGAPRDGSAETVESLGRGWVAEEALSIALYAALAARDFESGLMCAVTHSGDSDSTGAIAGNLLGLLYPLEALNHRWARQVECADLIAEIAERLAKA